MTIAIPQVNVASDTFGQWLQKFNLTLNALSTQIITTDSNTTVGNSAITGAWQANVIYAVSALSGGSNGNTANLAITSNAIFSANAQFLRVQTVNTAIINTATIETATINNFSVNSTSSNSANITTLNTNTFFANTANVLSIQINDNSVHVTAGNTLPTKTTYRKSFGTLSSPTQVSTSFTIGEFIWEAYGNTAFVPSAGIRIKRNGAVTDTASGANLVLCTTSSTANTLIERVSVGTDGSLSPINDASQDLGATSFRWANVYATFARIGNTTVATTISNTTINTATLNATTANISNINVGNANILLANVTEISTSLVTSSNIVVNSTVNVGNTTITSTITTTTSNTSTQIIDSFPLATYRGGRYTTGISLANGASYQISELLVLHNGSNTFVTEFGIVFTTFTLGSFSASANATHALISFTPVFANNTLKLSKMLFTV